MKKILPLLFSLVATALCSPLAADDGWISDFDAAKATAAKEGKDLLLDFTGSDWCGWCIKLKNEVFSQETFKTAAPKQFVLVEVDFPRGFQLADKLKRQNSGLQRAFSIEGYPTIILTDAKGRAYAKTGYKAGGPEKYLAHLAELRAQKTARDENLAKAAKATGVEKAKLLDSVVELLENAEVFFGYDDLLTQIVEADKENKGGLKVKYEVRQQVTRITNLAESGDKDGAMKQIEAMLKSAPPKGIARQEATFFKAALTFDPKQPEAALALLKTALEADPASKRAEQITQLIEKLKSP